MKPLLCALLLLCTTPAFAASTMDFYTDRQAFDNRVGASTLLTLDSPDPGTFPCPALQWGCNVTYDDGLVTTAIDDNPGCGIYGNICFGSFPMDMYVTVPVYAFGFDVTGAITFLPDNSNIPQAIGELLGQQVTVSAGQFYGWVSQTPFSAYAETANIQSSDIWWMMDNLEIRTAPFQQASFQAARFQATTVPEPSTVLLLGLGLVGVIAWKRRGYDN